VSLFTDQVSKNDLSRDLAEKHGFRIAGTIEEALTLGGDKLAVAGVLSIGEHGEYPWTKDTAQHMYPRRRFFDAIAATYRKYGRVVPLFNDKHLAYTWADAKHMYDTAREMTIPFLAGSSIPFSSRTPPVERPRGCNITEALGIDYGNLESYGFHALEGVQCMVERRQGGETGVAAVQAVRREEIGRAEKAGRWSRALLDASAATCPAPARGRPKELAKDSVLFLVEYRDGLKAAVAMSTGLASTFAFAGRLGNDAQPLATSYRAQQQGEAPYPNFAHLLKGIEHTIHIGRPAYPVERTLLVSGILDALMHSHADGSKIVKTPELAISYEPADWPYANAPAGSLSSL
jgi:hypothetical protein